MKLQKLSELSDLISRQGNLRKICLNFEGIEGESRDYLPNHVAVKMPLQELKISIPEEQEGYSRTNMANFLLNCKSTLSTLNLSGHFDIKTYEVVYSELKNLTKISLNYYDYHPQEVTKLDRNNSITSLRITDSDGDDMVFSSLLEKLPEIKYLKFLCGGGLEKESWEAIHSKMKKIEEISFDSLRIQREPGFKDFIFPTVKSLSFEFNRNCEWLAVVSSFPNVECLKIKIYTITNESIPDDVMKTALKIIAENLRNLKSFEIIDVVGDKSKILVSSLIFLLQNCPLLKSVTIPNYTNDWKMTKLSEAKRQIEILEGFIAKGLEFNCN